MTNIIDLNKSLDGQAADAEWQPYRRRTEWGQPLESDQPIPRAHYRLFFTGAYLWHYVHSSVLPVDYEDPPGE